MEGRGLSLNLEETGTLPWGLLLHGAGAGEEGARGSEMRDLINEMS